MSHKSLKYFDQFIKKKRFYEDLVFNQIDSFKQWKKYLCINNSSIIKIYYFS